jgi:hypothetical protein
MQGSINRRVTVQTDPMIKQDPFSKITKAKRAGSITSTGRAPASARPYV